MLKKLMICAVFCAMWTTLTAQEQIGSRLNNFSGSLAYSINPAFAAGALKWDVNLMHASIFVANDYVFLPNTSLLDLVSELNQGQTLSPEYAIDKQMDGALHLRLQGPSFMVNTGNFSFGASISGRVGFFAENVDSQLGYYDYAQIPVGETITVEPLKIGALAWTEYGLYLGKPLINSRHFDLKAGIHLKYLQAYEAVYFDSKTSASFTKGSDANNFLDMDVYLGYTADDSDSDYRFGQHKGGGFGADFGISYESKPIRAHRKIGEENTRDYQYDWKLGISVVDLGRVSFDQAKQFHYEETEPVLVSEQQIEAVGSIDEFNYLLIQQVYQGDSSQAIQPGNLAVWTPAALSVQYDKYLNRNFYFSALAVRRIPIPRSINRPNIFAATLRYERKFASISIPVVLYNDTDLRVGTALRLGWFEIGSDDLISIVGRGELNSTDLYAGIKINDFSLRNSDASPRRFKPGKVRRDPPCPTF